ncbi:MAG: DegT/DnrJ/EryC1/StrS family aminotransferase, partial [Desulfobacteria bacterium]
NAKLLTEILGEVPGIKAPQSPEGNHIYVYYPLTVEHDKRDDLRHYLLRHGIDSKITDMSDCSTLRPFQKLQDDTKITIATRETSLLEICVYPVISEASIRRIAKVIRAWAGLAEN